MAKLQAIVDEPGQAKIVRQAPAGALSTEERQGLEALARAQVQTLSSSATPAQREALASVLGAFQSANAYPTEPATADERSRALEGQRTLVFISTSIPEQTLRALFGQASGRNDVTFVLRGWFPPDLGGMMQRINALIEDKENAASVVVDPLLFREYAVQQVPMFLSRSTKDQRWYRLYGELALEGAEAEISRGRRGTVGQTWAIAEPDIQEEIETRIANYDWDNARERLAEDVVTSMLEKQLAFPTADRNSSRMVDLSIQLNRDITLPGGALLARAGERINPLELMGSQAGQYIVFDPRERKQLLVVQRWLQTYPHAVVMATHLSLPAGEQRPLSEVLGTSVYPAMPDLAKRLQIRAVPSIAYPNGLLMQVDEVKP